MPICMPPTTPPTKCHEPSPFGDVSSKLTPGMSEFKNYVRQQQNVLFQISILEQILANVREEVKRFQRRKQLNFSQNQSQHMNSQHQDSLMCESPTSPASPASCPRSPSPLMALASSNHFGQSCSTKEKPLFTFKQVVTSFFLSFTCWQCWISQSLMFPVSCVFVKLSVLLLFSLASSSCCHKIKIEYHSNRMCHVRHSVLQFLKHIIKKGNKL